MFKSRRLYIIPKTEKRNLDITYNNKVKVQ